MVCVVGAVCVLVVWVFCLSVVVRCCWQIQVSVYCFSLMSAHFRCTQWSSEVHLMDVCFLVSIWFVQSVHVHVLRAVCVRAVCVRVVFVGPGLVSTSPAFVSSNASHPARMHGWRAIKTVDRAPISGGRGGRRNLDGL